jgi:guanylate kinase
MGDENQLLSPVVKPLFIVLSGLSGAGKDAVLVRLKEANSHLEFITTLTTREKRSNEVDGIHYRFVSDQSFQKLITEEELLEWANVYGNWYGVPKEPVRRALKEGRDTVVKVDVQGAATIKKILPQAVFIFLVPPSLEDLAARLKGRNTETPSEMELRLKTAKREMKELPLFDYIVVNQQGDLNRAVSDIQSIITAEKCRVTSREIVV